MNPSTPFIRRDRSRPYCLLSGSQPGAQSLFFAAGIAAPAGQFSYHLGHSPAAGREPGRRCGDGRNAA
jgi:hypothetical protein